MPSIDAIRGSDGSENANLATVQSTRSGGASTIVVDTVTGWPTNFHASMGTPHTFVDPVTSETITVISEASAVDFKGHIDGGNIEIDDIAPGYTDNGSAVGDIVILKPTTQWADNVADTLGVEHNDDGSHKDITADSLQVSGTSNLASVTVGSQAVGLLGEVRTYENAGSPHTWTKPAGLKFIEVEVVGGGGSGGGTAATSGTQRTSGGSGGGGGYSYKKIAAASLGTTETVTVGAGGTPGAAGNNNGNSGGNSSFGSHCSATGGGGGGGAAAVGAGGFNGSNGGAPGTATGGDINISGTPGAFVATYDARTMASGLGGNSMLSTMSNVNTAGANFGGGGGASSVGISSSAASGGAGAPGIVIVREYY